MRQQSVLLAVVLLGCQVQLDESSTEQETVVLASTFDFGGQDIGTTSALHTVLVTPGAGNQNDTVTSVSASCPDFIVNATSLPATVYRVCEIITCTSRICPAPTVICQTTEIVTYSFDTYFRPTVAGAVSCVVSVRETDNTTGANNTKTITLTGTGQAPPKQIDVQPLAIGFGDVRRGSDSTQAQVTVRSLGTQALNVSSVTVSPGFVIKSGPTTGYQLPGNASQAYSLVCHPGGLGPMTGQLVVNSDDPLQSSIAVQLSCKGIDSNLDIQPSPAVLRTTRVGEPIDTTIDLTNTGGAPMNLESVTIQATGLVMTSTPMPGTMLAPTTGVAHVGVHFDASQKGDFTGTLTATYDGGQRRATQITARALATSMALTPDGDVDFGPVCAGQTKMQQFTMIANDQGSFSLKGVSDPGPPFIVSMPALPVGVQGAGANQVRFTASASPAVEGVAMAPLTLRTDIPGSASHSLNLIVQGLPVGVTATPTEIDLGSLPVNTTGLAQTAHLSNCSGSPIAFSNARIEGDDASEFTIVQAPSNPMIQPAGTASWLIVLTTHTVGPKQARFAVDFEGGTASIALLGEGLGDLPDAPGRGSYYACATGRPTALWPIALALALLLRRRRRS